jgi:A/G-specific adenine glycosylase
MNELNHHRIFNPQDLDRAGIAEFQEIIYRHYRENGRRMPWRETDDPYKILVSEIMLQQTQVERVLGKYEQFVAIFPDFTALASAGLRDIMEVWQGLGYNRRAMALQKTAQQIVSEFQGRLPESSDTLRTLPGIGQATAGALTAFAFNKPTVFIETNIRRVYLHFFFPDTDGVKDGEILPLVEETLDRSDVRSWYYALMDYGVMLKGITANPNRRSAHYSVQSRFEGSDRQIRGLILKALVESPSLTVTGLVKSVGKNPDRTKHVINQLIGEGFLRREGRRVFMISGSEANVT